MRTTHIHDECTHCRCVWVRLRPTPLNGTTATYNIHRCLLSKFRFYQFVLLLICVFEFVLQKNASFWDKIDGKIVQKKNSGNYRPVGNGAKTTHMRTQLSTRIQTKARTRWCHRFVCLAGANKYAAHALCACQSAQYLSEINSLTHTNAAFFARFGDSISTLGVYACASASVCVTSIEHDWGARLHWPEWSKCASSARAHRTL